MHSVVTAKTSTALWQRKRAQSFGSSGSNCAEPDNDVQISVTAMAINSAVTAPFSCHYYDSDVHIELLH